MIYEYKERNANGNYQAADGTRYLVHTARRVHGVRRACWQEYESLEAALEAMQLEPVPVPVPVPEEETLT
jgi:hypothetical protein